jgi:hypothetical protein
MVITPLGSVHVGGVTKAVGIEGPVGGGFITKVEGLDVQPVALIATTE